mmetsp:Transcript_8575/g.27341  ORF Transcript_8575/g.27341 Transcript_8575/m.27341 type:complete len:199 (-) Transcript_8575:166-762(-)
MSSSPSFLFDPPTPFSLPPPGTPFCLPLSLSLFQSPSLARLYSQLTTAPPLTPTQAHTIYSTFKEQKIYIITVVERAREAGTDTVEQDRSPPSPTRLAITLDLPSPHSPTPAYLLGVGSIFIEQKYIHGGGKVGHIEDVVVWESERGRGIGRQVVEALMALAKEHGCYKVILDAAEVNKGFYESCGLTKKESQFVRYF